MFSLTWARQMPRSVKAALVTCIQAIIYARALTPSEIAKATGYDLTRVLRGHFRNVSFEQPLTYLRRLDCDVDIVVKPANKKAFAPIHLETEA